MIAIALISTILLRLHEQQGRSGVHSQCGDVIEVERERLQNRWNPCEGRGQGRLKH
jgi:hypothetical protein